MSTFILRLTVCKITISLGSAVPVPETIEPEGMMNSEEEKKSALLKHTRRETAADVSTMHKHPLFNEQYFCGCADIQKGLPACSREFGQIVQ